MRTAKSSLLSIVIASLMVISVSSSAGVWEENFDDGNADGWNVITGEWSVENGVYQRTDMVPEYGKSMNEGGDWADYVLDVDVTIVEGGPDSTSVAVGMLLRTDETGSSGYRIWLRDDTNGFQFSVWTDNNFIHVITKAEERATPGQTYHLKVALDGFTLSAWVDDRLMFEDYVDQDRLFSSGTIGFINYNAHAQYDNLAVSGDTIAAVAPTRKLAITWGSIKD